jgi:hypothetical protein
MFDGIAILMQLGILGGLVMLNRMVMLIVIEV